MTRPTGPMGGITLPIGYIAATSARWFADADVLFSTVEEGRAKAVMFNRRFHRMLMSWNDHKFRGETTDLRDLLRTIDEIEPPESGSKLADFKDDARRQIEAALTASRSGDGTIPTSDAAELARKLMRNLERLCDELVRDYNIKRARVDEAKRLADREKHLRRAIDRATDEDSADLPSMESELEDIREQLNKIPSDAEKQCADADNVADEAQDAYVNFVIPHHWDVLEEPGYTPPPTSLENVWPSVFGGIHLIGVPPVYEIKRTHFRWVSWEYTKNDRGELTDEKGPRIHDEPTMSHILLQKDIYFVTIGKAEASNLIPFNVNLLLTITVENPYKAIFDVEQWLEATTNQVEADTRRFVGTKTFEELTRAAKATLADAPDPLNDELLRGLWRQINICRNDFGIRIHHVQILNVDPPAQFRELTLKKTTAELSGDADIALSEREKKSMENRAIGTANAIRIVADAESYQLDKTALRLAQHPHAVEYMKWRSLSQKDSPIRTLALGSNSLLAIPPDQPDAPPPPQAQQPQGGQPAGQQQQEGQSAQQASALEPVQQQGNPLPGVPSFTPPPPQPPPQQNRGRGGRGNRKPRNR